MLCIASHDAGGAEVLASWLVRHQQPCRLLLDGPAVRVFERRFGRNTDAISLEEALRDCDRFLTGSSWQSDLEWRVIRGARSLGKPVATFLDHWVHYRERFIREGEECLPDVLWTGDDDAFSLATRAFPGVRVERVENPYFLDLRDAVAALATPGTPPIESSSGGLRILFVCEPLSEHGAQRFGDPLHWGYTEFDALRYFFTHLARLGGPVQSGLIRPHPAERAGKYDAIAHELARDSGVAVRVGGDRSLLQEIADSDVVAGCESMAMVVGLIANRRVVSAIPPGGVRCSLPHKQIETLHDLGAQSSLREEG